MIFPNTYFRSDFRWRMDSDMTRLKPLSNGNGWNYFVLYILYFSFNFRAFRIWLLFSSQVTVPFRWSSLWVYQYQLVHLDVHPGLFQSWLFCICNPYREPTPSVGTFSAGFSDKSLCSRHDFNLTAPLELEHLPDRNAKKYNTKFQTMKKQKIGKKYKTIPPRKWNNLGRKPITQEIAAQHQEVCTPTANISTQQHASNAESSHSFGTRLGR